MKKLIIIGFLFLYPFYAEAQLYQNTLDSLQQAIQTLSDDSVQGIKDYDPEVLVSRIKTEEGVRLTIKDNGPGIPDSIKDKIFQPFFITKPTGQGTVLGLSWSYDIVKAHGGKIRVESNGCEFKIILKNLYT